MSTGSKFASDCLQAHNDKRKKHGVGKLKLNSELCVLAQNWAQQLVRSGELKHSKHEYRDSPLGENIAGKTSTGAVTEYTGAEVVDQWYSEIKDYDFKGHTSGIRTGHFSQVVWKDTKEMGVGMATRDGKCIVVANYTPAGNYVGMYKDNVFPSSEGKSAGAKVKSLFGGGSSKKGDDSSSSSDEEQRSGSRGGTTTKSYGTSKVTITKTIRKPDGTVETITEERVEENPSPSSFNNNLITTASKPSSAGKSKSKQSMSDFRKDALETHNKLRVKHKTAKLKLNSDLCEIAQKWAEHLASVSSLQHSTNNTHKGQQLGENIASKWGSSGADYTGEEVTQQWYSEESAYDYSGRSNAGASGHFTQVVWKGSEELGIGKASDSKGRVYVVANYKPAGNYIGNFAANVMRP